MVDSKTHPEVCPTEGEYKTALLVVYCYEYCNKDRFVDEKEYRKAKEIIDNYDCASHEKLNGSIPTHSYNSIGENDLNTQHQNLDDFGAQDPIWIRVLHYLGKKGSEEDFSRYVNALICIEKFEDLQAKIEEEYYQSVHKSISDICPLFETFEEFDKIKFILQYEEGCIRKKQRKTEELENSPEGKEHREALKVKGEMEKSYIKMLSDRRKQITVLKASGHSI